MAAGDGVSGGRAGGGPRVLVVARTYPNPVLPALGLWARRIVAASMPDAAPTVIAAVPYVPPGVPFQALVRYRGVPRWLVTDGLEVWHPRVPGALAQGLHSLDARLAYPWVRRLADRLHAEHRFDLVHAHFIYPDGVIGARLARRYGIPLVVTEHAYWLPWMRDYPAVWRQVRRALPAVHTVTAASESLRGEIEAMAAGGVRTALLPNVLDDRVFAARAAGEPRDPDQLLFVGVIRKVKGLDVLVRALPRVLDRRPRARLLVQGPAFFRGYRSDEREVRRLVRRLGLDDRVRLTGTASPEEVALAMRRSAVVVVPSRRETFCTVIVEAHASGTPVVATRCGGPEEVLDAEGGVLVPSEDPAALAAGIEGVLARRESFDAGRLRARAVARYGMAVSSERIGALYRRVLG